MVEIPAMTAIQVLPIVAGRHYPVSIIPSVVCRLTRNSHQKVATASVQTTFAGHTSV
jgi:hypothetical protein